MPGFNKPGMTTRPANVKSPVKSRPAPSLKTELGAAGYERKPKGALYLLGAGLFYGSDKRFHENAGGVKDRFIALCQRNAVRDPEWFLGFIGYLRDEGNIRTASMVGAVEGVRARLADPGSVAADKQFVVTRERGWNRRILEAACLRPDEPQEMMAYWLSNYGRSMPKPLKRALGTRAAKLWGEYQLLKYDTDKPVRFADVLELAHPRPDGTPEMSALFQYAIDRRRHRGYGGEHRDPRDVLGMVTANQRLRAEAASGPSVLADTTRLRFAGMTWEDALSLAGSRVPKKALWDALWPLMSYEQLLKNLRNFDQAGMTDETAGEVIGRLTDPARVARSHMFPFRFLSAYRAVNGLRWAYPLERALNLSLGSVTALKGHTLVLVDRSPSMWESRFSDHSGMDWADAAALFGAALAVRAEKADLVEFWARSKPVPFRKDTAVLKLTEQFSYRPDPGGTDIPSAVRAHLKPCHARVIIITDEQTEPGWLPSNCGPGAWGGPQTGMPPTLIDDLVPARVPLYMWNFGGYRAGAAPSGESNRHTFGGLNDAAFRIVDVLEHGEDAGWPWEEEAAARLA